MDLHHTPVSRSALFSKQARPARPVDIPNWPASRSWVAKAGARGRTCTRTLEGLSGGRVQTPSALGYTGVRMVLPVRFALTLHGV